MSLFENALVWVLDDDDSIRWVLERAFKGADWRVQVFAEPQSMLSALETGREQPVLLITDVRMPTMSGMEVLERIQERMAAYFLWFS